MILKGFWNFFIEYSNDMSDIYKNREEHNPRKERGILIVFDDMIADMLSNKNCNLKLNLKFLLLLLCNLILLY